MLWRPYLCSKYGGYFFKPIFLEVFFMKKLFLITLCMVAVGAQATSQVETEAAKPSVPAAVQQPAQPVVLPAVKPVARVVAAPVEKDKEEPMVALQPGVGYTMEQLLAMARESESRS